MWALLSLATNGLLILLALFLLARDRSPINTIQASAASTAQSPWSKTPHEAEGESAKELGRRHQLTYEQWQRILKQEADAAIDSQPENLVILAGDSLSLWFPADLLPPHRHWLNQGISGETSEGLLKRLDLFDKTHPRAVFVMIGINDLIRGVRAETILANQTEIIRYLKRTHPDTEIVVQSILPHGSEQASWEGRDRLLAISNERIRAINQQLAQIAREEEVRYLDLFPLFADAEGNLQSKLSTDGLHLNSQGYLVWRSALYLYDRLELKSIEATETGSV